jgi:pyridoxamine 5'-phosphate oxidase
MNDLSDYRKSYEKDELIENNIPEDPINLFHQWFCMANDNEMISEANAMSVATIGLDGFPKTRVVLLKKYNEEGFIFYTNYHSEKGKAIENNPKVSLSFFWQALEKQIIIKGTATKIAANISDNYFESRPRGSQLGAIVSDQSKVIENRAELENSLKKLENSLENFSLKRPENWGGYLVTPHQIEFWQGRPNRLHDRIRYTLQENFSWKIERLAP